MRKVLVTGGAGYIGSHVCKLLAVRGYEPIIFDNLSRGWRDLALGGPLIVGDLRDRASINQAMEDVRPDGVMHFAGLTYVDESVRDPEMYYQNNLCGTFNLLAAMKLTGVPQIIFSSTCATYGAARYLPIDEQHPQEPVTPYGWSKLMVERLLADYAAAYGLRSVSLRYFNAAGADPDGEIGERHEPETHLIPRLVQSALDGSYKVEIYGTDYPTRDGTPIRDYVHVMDLADAHLLALEHLEAGGRSGAYNLGTGVGVTVREVLAAVEHIAGRRFEVLEKPPREGDPAALVADAKLAQRILEWTPKHSGIDEIVATAWNWHKRDARTTR